MLPYSLQSELDACKNSPEEQKCQELGKELNDLQRKCYHKQMKLQTARQSRMVAPSTNQHLPQMPAHVGHSGECDEAEVINLVDDEWLETGAFDKFDDDNDATDDVFIEDEWDLDEIELDRNMSQPSMERSVEQNHQMQEEHRTVSQQKSLSTASKCSAAATNFQSACASSTSGERGQRNRIPPIPHTKGGSFTMPTPRGSQPKAIGNPREHQVWSPFPGNIPRKRPGESIFKASKAQIQQ